VKIADILAIKAQSRVNDLASRAISRAAGSGTLRGAMSGAILADGKILSAKCPRLEQARFNGVEATTSEDAGIIFAAGFGHEEYLKSMFSGAGIELKDVKGEPPVAATFFHSAPSPSPIVYREIGVSSEVHGVPWRGTPDFMYWDGTTWHGIEAKSQVSNYGVVKSIRSGWPQRKHILQCANYMSVMGLSEWMLIVGHYFFAQADNDKFAPDIRCYRVFLTTQDGVERFAVENQLGETIVLDFDRASVLSYLKLLLDSDAAKKLAPRPTWTELFPNMKGYDECNYCSAQMSNECNRADVGKLDYAGWMERLKQKTK
jgi:hypothetical protein